MTLRIRLDWWDSNTRVLALLVILTVVPAACVLWFMNAALSNAAAAAQQQIDSAYRGQLRLVRSRLEALWRGQAERLNAPGDPSRAFEHLITSQLAEGAVLLDADGYVAFPWTDARGDLSLIEERLAAASQLSVADRAGAVRELADRLNDYGRHLPAGDRLRLMDDLRALAPNVWLPTEAALRLSLDLVDAERPEPAPDVVRQTSIPGVWALTSADRHTIGLYRTGRVEAILHDFLHQVSPAGIVFVASPPGVPADADAIAAGPWLPGWQLSYVPLDPAPVATGDRRRQAVYLSVALTGIVVILLTVVTGGRALRRHLHVARLQTDLAAAVSHELRTPLASMRVLVDGLLADRELDPVKTREYLSLLATENDRLARLITNFLTFSRLERETPRFEPAPVAAGDVARDAVAAVRQRVPDREIRVSVAEGLPLIVADHEAVTTALVNLLDNAVKYSPDRSPIEIDVQAAGRDVLFAVTDHGIGIATREQRRIFRRFYRVEGRLTSATAGVGLGLSIVDLIARGHGGEVTVRSAPGAGSTFTLRLPAALHGAAA